MISESFINAPQKVRHPLTIAILQVHWGAVDTTHRIDIGDGGMVNPPHARVRIQFNWT